MREPRAQPDRSLDFKRALVVELTREREDAIRAVEDGYRLLRQIKARLAQAKDELREASNG